jgi:hypothetical protein
MSQELWATYSVKDHLQPRVLAADIMLFDRLVFPVPEKAEVDGHPIGPGPVKRERNDAEWERWENEHWDPTGQARVLKWLEPVIRKLPWENKGAVYDEYRTQAAKLAAAGLPDYAFDATRTVLSRDLPAYVTGVAAVGPSYCSVREIKRELGIRKTGGELPGGALAAVLAWEFFAPDPDDMQYSDEELLRETVRFVTQNADFQNARAAFNDFQRKFLRQRKGEDQSVTDLESITRAVQEMSRLLADAKQAAEQLTIRKIARCAFRLTPPALTIAGLALGLPPITTATSGFFFTAGSIVVDEKFFKSAEERTPPATAFVQDAQRHFGWQ